MSEQDKDATIKALVRALTKRHTKKPLPTIPIGTRVRVHDSGAAGIGTVVGRDGYGFDAVMVIFDEPAPRGFEDGCCAGVDQCEVLTTPPTTADGDLGEGEERERIAQAIEALPTYAVHEAPAHGGYSRQGVSPESVRRSAARVARGET